ncbi:uncharacterized protein [Drosophila virilis]|uniref:DUF243 domain-containing protein n=1 Tax=Drosophila virilis TaxID=7244 RepID=B4MC37_DROVI|nr:uncharacterized protein LOC6635047 [Drosophila virilis]EDW58658.1 uncharacterized protein Dvir_GJ14173 [Drosophila virilis]
MRHFFVFLCCCLAALASADKLGYNYQPVAHSGTGLSFAPGGAASNVSPSYASGPAPASDSTNAGFAQPSSVESSYQPSGSIAEPSADAPNYAAAQPKLQKEFFTYTANEEDFQDAADSEKVSGSLNKALRVVFIKGPESRGLEQAALALSKQAGQQDTAIYVLNNQADIADLANKLNAIRSNTNNKPEVHFVKYRTPEDAAKAQQAIEGQYDQLGGSASRQDGGVAPVIDFASKGPAPAAVPEASAPAPQAAEPEAVEPVSSYIPPVTPGSTYLPANILRRFRF